MIDTRRQRTLSATYRHDSNQTCRGAICRRVLQMVWQGGQCSKADRPRKPNMLLLLIRVPARCASGTNEAVRAWHCQSGHRHLPVCGSENFLAAPLTRDVRPPPEGHRQSIHCPEAQCFRSCGQTCSCLFSGLHACAGVASAMAWDPTAGSGTSPMQTPPSASSGVHHIRARLFTVQH